MAIVVKEPRLAFTQRLRASRRGDFHCGTDMSELTQIISNDLLQRNFFDDVKMIIRGAR
jgi:hypothetical protein